MEQENKKINYFLYARKSSENEDRQVQSIDDQIHKLKELAENMNMPIVKIFTEAKSAKKPDNRPIFNDMIRQIENGRANGILCWQINRLSRNPVDSGKLSWMLQNNVIKSIQTIDRKYLPEDNVIIFSVESGAANQFILDLRRNTIRGIESKVEKGWLPALAPQGYMNELISKTIIKDPERFDVMRRVWDLMLTGKYSAIKILDIINNEWDYKTRKTKRAGGKAMSQSEIYRILKDPFYYGYFKYNGKLYEGKHEPMITMEEYERVQELLGRKTRSQSKTREFAFTGIIRCGYCGCQITAEEKTKYIKCDKENRTYTYYRCTRRKKEISCKEPSITLTELEKRLAQELDKITIPTQFKDWAVEIIKKLNEKEINDREKSYKIFDEKYIDLQKQLDNLTKLKLKELITDEEFTNKRKELQIEIIKIREKQKQNQDRGQHWIETMEKAFNFAAHARQVFLSTDDISIKREIISALGCHFKLQDGQLLVEPSEWLVSISDLAKISKNQMERLEPAILGEHKSKNRALDPALTQWGPIQTLVIN
ncbi:MAG: recombinase family protein [Patescibacteria group bacterium]|jgi:DNA invertase Pin-like site-specific DNA recombinase